MYCRAYSMGTNCELDSWVAMHGEEFNFNRAQNDDEDEYEKNAED